MGRTETRTGSYLLGIMLLCGLAASFLYVGQGGFAMGNKPFDVLIVVLLLPGFAVSFPLTFLLVIAGIPESKLTQFEYFFVVAVPVAFNLICVKTLDHFLALRRGKQIGRKGE